MPLPTTNLTLHLDASDTGKVFTTHDMGGNHSGVPADGDPVQVWDDEGDGIANIACAYGGPPDYRSATPLMEHPCLDFNGSTDFLTVYQQDGATNRSLADLINADAFTILAAFYAEAITLNNASLHQNHLIFGDSGTYFAIALRTNGSGTYYVQMWNYAGAYATIELTINLTQSYVLVAQHASGQLKLSVIEDGAGSTRSASDVASGDTESLTGNPQIGGLSGFFHGRIGEMAFYDAALSGGDLTSAKQHFYEGWFPAPPGGGAGSLGMPMPSSKGLT